MAVLLSRSTLAFMFGVLGNIVSVGMFLAPAPTFYTIIKRKSSGGFQSFPYSVAIMSAMLLLYYGLLKDGAYLIISINTFGTVLELIYLIIYLVYAPKKEKMFTLKLIIFFNIGSFGVMLLLTNLLAKGSDRANVVGWICGTFSVAVCAAPLSIMRRVIKTKSVEYMPFTLSFALTLNATMWFFYGLFVDDYYIALPNVLGFLFGITQMILYMLYKNAKKDADEKPKQLAAAGPVEVKVISTANNESGGLGDPHMETKMYVCDVKPMESNENKKIEMMSTNV